MPLSTSFTARDHTNAVHTFNLLTQVNGDASVRRLDAASPIGYPVQLTASGKLVKASASRVFPVDQFTIYSSGKYPHATLGDYEFGCGITLNMPRVGLTNPQVQSQMEMLHLYAMQYLANLEFASADVTAGKVPWTMPGLAYLINGIR